MMKYFRVAFFDSNDETVNEVFVKMHCDGEVNESRIIAIAKDRNSYEYEYLRVDEIEFVQE